MSSLVIQDLAHNAALDNRAMSAVRGGNAFGQGVNVNVNVNQQIGQFQQIGINVLNNNGVIGAGFVGPDIKVPVSMFAENKVLF
jgi:hypothetical protein